MDEAHNSDNQPIGIIVLAAGASRRMNEPKQLLLFEGKTLLRRAVETAVESIYQPIIVVLGANVEKMRLEIEDLPVELVFNQDWQRGLSSSIKIGLEMLLRIAKLSPGNAKSFDAPPEVRTPLTAAFLRWCVADIWLRP